MAEWNLLTNHGHALLCVARDPGMTLRQIGDCIGITE
nr:AsnC family transcriptional regulator [Thermoleophilaceae bacterium]MBA2567043.1 AsnC family transcriptional regulator [Thermoleophilaceae bacterium]